nr:hypothetical protein [Tanacetum cinerariifolium]
MGLWYSKDTDMSLTAYAYVDHAGCQDTRQSQAHKAKSGLSSTRMNVASSVRRSMNRGSHDKNNILANSKNSAKQVAVYVRKNKQTDNTFANVISNKENVIDVDVANASKAKNLLCVSCMKNVLIVCHDKCLVNHRLNMHFNARRTLSTKPRTPKSSNTTYVGLKTRFSEKLTQSKTLDTTSIVSKPNIDVGSKNKTISKRPRSTRGQSFTSQEISLEEKIQRFKVFENEVHQLNYDTLARRLIHSGDVIDWEFLAQQNLDQAFFDSIIKPMNTPSKKDFDNLFGPMFEEYFRKKSSDTPINFAAQPTQLHEDLPSTSSINIEEHEAPPFETTYDKQTSPISLAEADELHQEDSANFDGNSQFVLYNPTSYEAIESSSMALEPSNV